MKIDFKSIIALLILLIPMNLHAKGAKEVNMNDLKSTEVFVISNFLDNLSESEKSAFINANLDKKNQHLSRLVTISSNRMLNQVETEVELALNDGLSVVEIKEAIYHSAAYCGYTRAAATLGEAEKVLEKLGKSENYSSRITSTESTRYSDGLAVQRHLFGPKIGTVTEEMTEPQRLQTIFLSGMCFGDFYNRLGLPLLTREFITLHTIVANGNCAPQVSAHTMGNFLCGHSADMLRAAILYNMDLNGKEKTVVALTTISKVAEQNLKASVSEPERNLKSVPQNYKSDSDELLGIISHYKTDDNNHFVDSNLTKAEQEAITKSVEDFIEGKSVSKSSDKKTQALIDLAIVSAEGGKESEVPELYKKNMEFGNNGDTLLATALLLTPYNGFPRTLNIMGAITKAIQENSTKNEVNNMETNLENSVIFDKGEVNPFGEFFIGTSYLKMLTTSGVPIGNVTFEPGCRNNWHIHHADENGGQILLCTGGRGWYQEWGKPAQELHAGDVVVIPAGVKHWHGAAKDSWFVHLAVEVPGVNAKSEWLEPVSDEDYSKLK